MSNERRPAEHDTDGRADRDEHQALSREAGGVPDDDAPDQHSSTGTTPNDTVVGEAVGQDVGYAGETGAERRAAWEEEHGQR